jgi:hypothetical protein
VQSYLNFDLLFDKGEGGVYKVRVIDSPVGRVESHFDIPYTQSQIKSFIKKHRGMNTRSFVLDEAEKPPLHELGEALYSSLFSSEIRSLFQRSLDIARTNDKGLRVRLLLSNVPELISLPWEYMYDHKQQRYIGNSKNSPIIRSLDLVLQKPKSTFSVKGTLNVLVMISSPQGLPPLDVEKEKQWIYEATKELQNKHIIKITLLSKATLANLQDTLRKEDFHVFHYIGHGDYNQTTQEGALVFEDEEARPVKADGDLLDALFHDDTVRLAVLNTCSGARSSLDDPFAGVAQSLLLKGRIPAVVAMQFEISDEAAITFTKAFYAALLDNYSIDAAMAEARKSIYITGNKTEWGTPVLYMNTDTAAIFEIQKGLTSKIPNFLKQPSQQAGKDGVEISNSECPEIFKGYFWTKLFITFIVFSIVVHWLISYVQKAFPNRINNPEALYSKRYVDLEDGSIRDKKTGYEWSKCTYGFSGENCKITIIKDPKFTWTDAQDISERETGWRLPTKDELHTLVYCNSGVTQEEAKTFACDGKNNKDKFLHPTIFEDHFPHTQANVYWTKDKNKYSKDVAWAVYFRTGEAYNLIPRENKQYIRLIRDKNYEPEPSLLSKFLTYLGLKE